MPRKPLEELTESMFYLLLAFCSEPMCGIQAAEKIEQLTGGRVRLGPATLYTILGKFEKEGYLKEIAVDGRKRTYCITQKGLDAYKAEVDRLTCCINDTRQLNTSVVQTAEQLTAAKPQAPPLRSALPAHSPL